ncbi:Serine/threonine-protein kinase [Wickerhamomyces ciferrii]|uniref:Serine/threonine-protein kinase n=1 Tax=Wickerhamomyces ciferrii (strain ATCC 14091 / BCRC 22168 / CBS 111 / JCM 3599 / NBRC 0793 / NRRL Y-1031 F-60-10) TaxID=1206466 RepID=K0KPV4_WICCF|nr:Serine/threonine-protein kinase [Wickerhamomyces ciferrii]CCH45051.1 Serine/threonine-protein kinase [Wickerhamomyces ciferrii]
MVKPATQRRRNKVYQQQLQQQQLQQQQAQQAQKQKEDDAGGLHDEADVMSFRSAAAHRFILNQELIENVTEKWVHTNGIIRPKPFTQFQTKQNINEIKDELYFGNIELMRQKAGKLEKELEEVKAATQDINKGPHNNRKIRGFINELSESFVNPVSHNVETVEKSFEKVVNKPISFEPYTIKSIPKLKTDTSEAPPNYWEEIKKAKEQEASAVNNPLVISDQGYIQEDPVQNNPEPIPYVEAPPAFGTDDINMIDDVGFGLHSTLDDQDFLSQFDHSME